MLNSLQQHSARLFASNAQPAELPNTKPPQVNRLWGPFFVTVLFGSYVHINVYNRAVQSSSSSSVQIMGKP